MISQGLNFRFIKIYVEVSKFWQDHTNFSIELEIKL